MKFKTDENIPNDKKASVCPGLFQFGKRTRAFGFLRLVRECRPYLTRSGVIDSHSDALQLGIAMTTASTGRLAEHLVCAELGRRGLIATTFTHNIPRFDVMVADENCRMLPIQVKGTNEISWTFDADKLMEIKFDEEKQTQIIVGEKTCANPELIWVCVVVKSVANPNESQQRDQFFICTKRDIHQICVSNYRMMLEGYSGHRPRKWKSLRYFWNTDDLVAFENKWETILERMSQLCCAG